MKRFCFFICCFFVNLYGNSRITILTERIGAGSNKIAGHYGVTRSLLNGLKRLGVDFVYNPISANLVTDTVVALAGIDTLENAINLKRQGKIKKLFAGPNIIVMPYNHNYIIASKEIDVCIVPSEWVGHLYQMDAPSLNDRIRVWPAGVDDNYWVSSNNRLDTNKVLVYWKTESYDFCKNVETILSSYGWSPIILKYGSYNNETYKKLLNSVSFAVFISTSESQGLALAEAWAMNIPTIVWNPKKFSYEGKSFNFGSACPYLTKYSGQDWENFDEFKDIISKIKNQLPLFSPRKWVLENMTDEICAQNLLDIIH